MTSKTVQIKNFLGVDNVASPERLAAGWLQSAVNVDITPEGAITRRPGRTLAMSGAFTAAYGTKDQADERLYVVDGGSMKQIQPDMSALVLATGLSNDPMYWAEVNGATYFSNGPDKGVIQQDGIIQVWDWPMPDAPTVSAIGGSMPSGQYGVACTFTLPDGRETGASDTQTIALGTAGGLLISQIPHIDGLQTNVYISPADSTVCQYACTTTLQTLTWNASPDALGEELLTHGMEPIPEGARIITAWRGRLWAAQYLSTTNTTVVWMSEPLGFHLFNPQTGFIQIPGEVTMLLAHDDGLVIGSRSAVWEWSGEALVQLAGYGVPAGHPGARDEETGDCYFWTDRGLCRALPFSNLTAGRLHTDPGTHASTAIVQHAGLKKLVATTRPSGAVFNPRTTS